MEAAVLAAVPRHLVDGAVLVAVTRVDHVLLDASAEEPLQTGRTHRRTVRDISRGQPSEQQLDVSSVEARTSEEHEENMRRS